jgi:two-component system OmpR family response regulator
VWSPRTRSGRPGRWTARASGTSSIEVYIHRLRRKLEGSGLAIRTVRGLGYLLEAEAAGP